MRLAFFQLAPEHGEMERNLSVIRRALSDVQADLVVLPELATTGYMFRDRAEVRACAETVPGRTVDQLAEICARGEMHVVCGLAELQDGHIYNSAVLVGPGGLVAVYRKAHLFSGEKRLFDPGDGELAVHEVAGARVGMLVCFDWIFPEAARSLALAGADVIAHPSNLVLPWAQSAVVTRCIENRVYWVLANRTGAESLDGETLTFTGRSRIAGPGGRVLLDAGASEDTLGVVDVDPLLARDKSVNPHNDLFADRRPGLYSSLTLPQGRR